MLDQSSRWRPRIVLAGAIVALLAAGAARALVGGGTAPASAGPVLPDAPAAAATWLPGFLLESDGGTTGRPPAHAADGVARLSTAAAEVEIRRAGDDEWELVVHARRALDGVWFPWHSRASALDPRSPSTVVLYPTMLGVAAQGPSALALGFDWRAYPGELFAPLLVLADARRAEVVAATNWPPRSVVPVFSRDGIAMRYVEPVPAGATRRYRALIAQHAGDESLGRPPWLLAALAYRDWLVPNLRREGLSAAAPQWLVESEGWQNVQLQNLHAFDPAALSERWRRWQGLLPWMQVWGQMSGYAGRSGVLAKVGLGEEVGCCIDRTTLHERYRDGLASVGSEVARAGRIGFYARPRSPYRRLDGADPAATDERAFLLGWLARNRTELGANAYYVDVIGHRFFGEPLAVARFVRDQLPPATVIEYAVDVYPRPALVSGSLGGGSFGGGPSREPRELGALVVPRTTFPRFGRAILGDALLFLGESNGDHVLWGEDAGHWAERQALLLGAKLDAMRVAVSLDRPLVPNPALARIVALRRAAGWWQRRPVYLDRLGVAGAPDEVDVRRFRGSAGEVLLVADNPGRRAGVTVRLDGRAVTLDAEPLSIRIVETGA